MNNQSGGTDASRPGAATPRRAATTARRAKTAKSRDLLRIGEVARLVGVSASCLRNWERRGLFKAARTESGYRLYSRTVVTQLKHIQHMRSSQHLNIPAIQLQQDQGIETLSTHTPEQFVPELPARLAALRRDKGFTLRDVAQKIGVSASFISAIERGQGMPSFATLHKMAEVYGTTVLSFFNVEGDRRKLVRRKDRRILRASGPSVQMELLAFDATLMEPHLMRIAPRTSSGGSYRHIGEELVYILEGKLELWLDEIERYVLEPGDSLYFKSTQAHRWRSLTDRECVVLWVNAPPSF
jgi:DNA-binding transcriptional MerR regulator/mannose-6-phosphate isomerase-like protein (cupin superfamily)